MYRRQRLFLVLSVIVAALGGGAAGFFASRGDYAVPGLLLLTLVGAYWALSAFWAVMLLVIVYTQRDRWGTWNNLGSLPKMLLLAGYWIVLPGLALIFAPYGPGIAGLAIYYAQATRRKRNGVGP